MTGRARAPSASPRAAAAAAERREGATVPCPHQAKPHQHQPPEAVPAQGRLPQGRPRPVGPPAPTRTPPGITLPQLQRQQDARRVIQEGGHGAGRGRVPATGAQSEGREATGGAPRDGRRGRGRAHTARREGKGTDTAPRPAAAGENRHTGQARVRAADDGTQDTAGKGQGDGKDAGASSSATGRAQ